MPDMVTYMGVEMDSDMATFLEAKAWVDSRVVMLSQTDAEFNADQRVDTAENPAAELIVQVLEAAEIRAISVHYFHAEEPTLTPAAWDRLRRLALRAKEQLAKGLVG